MEITIMAHVIISQKNLNVKIKKAGTVTKLTIGNKGFPCEEFP